MSRYLPQAIVATGMVVAAPVVAVWALRAGRVVDSTVVAVLIGVVLSIAVSFAGSAYWASSDSSRDVLFSELMIWGWLRRWRAEHKVTAALESLGRRTVSERVAASTGQLSMLTELAEALEAGDPYTRGHSRRVARYATMIADRLGLAPEEVDRIRTAAAVHDVGKVRTPIEVLHKPGRLTDEEYAIVKAHPVDGARLVEALGDERITAIVRHHHERLDGRGYPSGLSGAEIPLGARIVAVADTFDAITSARPYRPASPHRKALDILIKEAGTQLDADAVRAFRACYTGRRPFALWMTLLAFPQRLTTTLGNGTTVSAVSISKAVAAASTVAVVGGAAASAAPPLPAMSASTTARTTAAVQSSASAASSAAPVTVAAAPAPAPASATRTATATANVEASFTTAAAAREHSAMRRIRVLERSIPRTPRRTHAVNTPARHVPAAPPAQPQGTPTAPVPSAPPVVSAPVPTIAAAPRPVVTAHPHPTPVAAASGRDKGKSKDKGKGKDKGDGKAKGDGQAKGSPASTTKGSGSSSGNGKGKGSGNGAADGSGVGKGGGAGKGSGAGKGGGAAKGDGNGAANGNGNGNGSASGAANGNGNGGPKGSGDANGAGTGNGTANGSANGAAYGNGNADGSGNGKADGNGNGNGNANGAANGNGSDAAATNGNGNGKAGTGATGPGTGDGSNHHGP